MLGYGTFWGSKYSPQRTLFLSDLKADEGNMLLWKLSLYHINFVFIVVLYNPLPCHKESYV